MEQNNRLDLTAAGGGINAMLRGSKGHAAEEARNNISFEKNYFAKAEIFEGGKVMLSAADAKNFMIAQISQELDGVYTRGRDYDRIETS